MDRPNLPSGSVYGRNSELLAAQQEHDATGEITYPDSQLLRRPGKRETRMFVSARYVVTISQEY
jgi:hypothetical protein